MSAAVAVTTCMACLGGDHRRCERIGCACSICRAATFSRTGRVRNLRSANTPRIHRAPRATSDSARSTGPHPGAVGLRNAEISEADKDEIAAMVLRLVTALHADACKP